ncbi:MAG: nicotinate (nicotinamide) nucleotide adenylyltransferase [Oscillospiraceae bacterium]|nr:nicotinate (nicotinamide) nucleotide adenylyltransferase [Oscillospiraceae bacterium]
MAKIGVYGGTFNPPHLGHRLAICEFAQKLALDRVIVIPDAEPPHKTMPEGSPAPEVRLQLCRMLIEGLPFAEVSDLEIRRSGKSYTADTMEELKALYPDDTLVFLMGTDMLLTFDRWVAPERITACAELAMAHRKNPSARERDAIAKQKEKLERDYGAVVTVVENDLIDMSSTAVRAMLCFGCGEEVVGKAIAASVKELGLYRTGSAHRGLPFSELCEVSLSLHKQQRIPHVKGCCETAVQLAKRWGADPDAAARAGILHDITKVLSTHEQLILCEKYDILLDDFTRKNPQVLHAITGSVVAREIFGESEAVCAAIRWHTTGHAGMTTLEKIIYLADLIEPVRDFDGVDALRELAERDLDAVMAASVERCIRFVRDAGKTLHPDSLAALQDLRQIAQSRALTE